MTDLLATLQDTDPAGAALCLLLLASVLFLGWYRVEQKRERERRALEENTKTKPLSLRRYGRKR